MSHLPSPGLGIDQTTDRLHDRRINQMGTPEAVGHDCPIFYPADAMLHPDPDGAQPGIEGLLSFRQFLAGHFFEGCADRQAGDQQPEPRFGVADSDQTDLPGHALVAFVRQCLATVGQPCHGRQAVAGFLVVDGAGHADADGQDVNIIIGRHLGFQREGFLFS